jgi:hypothetical protein
MAKIILAVNQDKKDLADAIVQAISDLDLIINNADTMTLAQARTAIKILAQHQKKIIKRLVQIA